MKNIEVKYAINNPELIAQRLTSTPQVQVEFRHYQKDIYFDVPEGRMKIRLEERKQPCLIRYYRPDQATARISDYTLNFLDDFSASYEDLKMIYGVLVEVEKIRELHLYKNVRIHLDNVTDLGWFLEFESVISEDYDYDASRKNLQEIQMILGDLLGEVQPSGYMNLLLEKELKDLVPVF